MLAFLFLRRCFAHGGEEDDVADGLLIGHQHGQSVNAKANTPGRGHSYLHRFQEIFIEHLSFIVALRSLASLILKTRPLIEGIIEFSIGVAHLQRTNERLEALNQTWKLSMLFGER